MKKLVLIALVAVGLAVGAVVVPSAITNGQPDAGRHPYVGLLVFDDAPGQPAWRCSGSLISETVVLTAAHCTDGAVAARFWTYEDMTYNNVPFPLYPYGGPGSGAVEGTPYTNPGFTVTGGPAGGNGLQRLFYNDVGVVVLDSPIAMGEYAALPAAGLVDTLKNKTAVDFVGYGVQYQVMQYPGQPPGDRWVGPRLRLYAPTELVSGRFVSSAYHLRLAMNPGGGSGGMCFGDSGGPDVLAGTNTVLGVNSFVTNSNCSGVGYSTRVDVPEILAWISGFLP